MTYDDMYKLRRQWGLDPYHELYGWLMKREPGFVGHDMLKVVVIRMRDNWAWSAALASHVRVDGVLQRMEENFMQLFLNWFQKKCQMKMETIITTSWLLLTYQIHCLLANLVTIHTSALDHIL